MAKSGVGCRFRDLEYFEVGFIYLFTYLHFIFPHISRIHYKSEGHITTICRKNISLKFILSSFNEILDNYVLSKSPCTLLAAFSRVCRLFLDFSL